MRTIAQRRPTGFYGLLPKKAVRVAALLCSLVLVSTAINALIIVLGMNISCSSRVNEGGVFSVSSSLLGSFGS
jgi:hypothetical protein